MSKPQTEAGRKFFASFAPFLHPSLMQEDDIVAIEHEALPSVEILAEALPMHRWCDEHIRGHESCLDIARKQWANLRR